MVLPANLVEAAVKSERGVLTLHQLLLQHIGCALLVHEYQRGPCGLIDAEQLQQLDELVLLVNHKDVLLHCV